jgi:serralysin
LLDDIAAIQRLYGANMTTRVGNTTYGFNSNADDSAYHMDGDKQAVFSIWDAGGINTLDLSGYSTNQRLDLRQGEFSNAGVLTKNISIALGAIIQNGIGGQGNDTIIGNDSDNELTGNKGNDGIDGGAGRNVAIYSGAMKNYALTFSGAPSTVGSTFTIKDNAGTDGTDALTNVEELRFIDQTMSISS